MIQHDDEKFMAEALKEAKKAFRNNEVPIGAVLVHQGRIIARGYNQTELLKDVTAHAEMLVITAATADLGMKYLDDFTLYVTLEPCVMCAGALKWVRIGRLVYATEDMKAGFSTVSDKILHPKTLINKGVLKNESVELLQTFFRKRRT
jgi:tRNA(adenine34) deaminase